MIATALTLNETLRINQLEQNCSCVTYAVKDTYPTKTQ